MCKKGVWPPIFFHGWPLIYLGSLSFEFQVIWNIRILSNCTLNLTTLKIANEQIPVQKNFFTYVFFYVLEALVSNFSSFKGKKLKKRKKILWKSHVGRNYIVLCYRYRLPGCQLTSVLN